MYQDFYRPVSRLLCPGFYQHGQKIEKSCKKIEKVGRYHYLTFPFYEAAFNFFLAEAGEDVSADTAWCWNVNHGKVSAYDFGWKN